MQDVTEKIVCKTIYSDFINSVQLCILKFKSDSKCNVTHGPAELATYHMSYQDICNTIQIYRQGKVL